MTEDVKIFARTIEDEAKEQIATLAKHPVSDDSKVRIMPDVHAGAGCTIGTTMTITDRICPNLVGVDIGCGMLAVKLGVKTIDFKLLDEIIKWRVPSGFKVHSVPVVRFSRLNELICPAADKARANTSIGTLGGGNHFIEVDRGGDGLLWLVIHSGSRHLGLEVANWYQKEALDSLTKPNSDEIGAVIARCKAEGRMTDIAAELEALKKSRSNFEQKALAYLTGATMQDYLHDMEIVQEFAALNRRTITDTILKGMGLVGTSQFTTIHNYIDLDRMILRKGAVSAQEGEQIIIPMNMRDGSLICVGKGNEDWNYSAPHGAGRLMSRKAAKESFTLREYKDSMKGIYSSCVGFDTMDEAPFAYKAMDEIQEMIEPTCRVVDVIKPVYNFKASN